MAAVHIIEVAPSIEADSRPMLRLVSSDGPAPRRRGLTLAQRRRSRARMMRRRRRTLVTLGIVLGLVILAWPGHAFGGVTGAGLSTDLANSSVLASGMEYVVQPGDSVATIAQLINPVSPSAARIALVHELGSMVVVPGEHVLIP